jgi:hypothetical protein
MPHESWMGYISFQFTDISSQPSRLILNTETAILPPRQHGTDKQVPKQMSVSSTKYSQHSVCSTRRLHHVCYTPRDSEMVIEAISYLHGCFSHALFEKWI